MKPKPLASQNPLQSCLRFQRTYSENPPGAAQTSAKYSNSSGPTRERYKKINKNKYKIIILEGYLIDVVNQQIFIVIIK